MPDVRALQELLGLWRRYQRGENMPRGKSEWRELFSLLDRCEALGSAGRVPPETIDYWLCSTAINSDVHHDVAHERPCASTTPSVYRIPPV